MKMHMKDRSLVCVKPTFTLIREFNLHKMGTRKEGIRYKAFRTEGHVCKVVSHTVNGLSKTREGPLITQ